ncbi:MAG: hypothetical protein P0S96_05345 [Simkaniaceae bacterium]|nr:hypothetical protein [Candidatus Sacchlamyda saccharinae]
MKTTFKYEFFRRILHEIFQGSEYSVIAPYGFELLEEARPPWPRRHYIAIGYPRNWSRKKAEKKVVFKISEMIETLRRKYPEFFQRLVFVEIHRGRPWILFDSCDEIDSCSNTIHVDLFPAVQSISTHYARYILCLFGGIKEGNLNLPEIREFSLSKTRRNRFFQEYVMCDALFRKMDIGSFSTTPEEFELSKQLFEELRFQEISEIIPMIPTKQIKMKPIEKEICEHLIFPRLAKMRGLLEQRGQKNGIQLICETYFDDGLNRLIQVKISEKDYRHAVGIIKNTYHMGNIEFATSLS